MACDLLTHLKSVSGNRYVFESSRKHGRPIKWTHKASARISEHSGVEDFKIHEFAGKKLLTVELKDHARKSRNLPDDPIPFPCCYGRPVDQVLSIVRSRIDRTPRSRSSH